MQIAALLSPSPAPKEGTTAPAEGELSFESQWNQAVQAQQAATPEAVASVPTPVQETPTDSSEEVEPVPETETVVVLPSAVPLQEWEALAWVQHHIPPVVAEVPPVPVPSPQVVVPPAPEASQMPVPVGEESVAPPVPVAADLATAVSPTSAETPAPSEHPVPVAKEVPLAAPAPQPPEAPALHKGPRLEVEAPPEPDSPVVTADGDEPVVMADKAVPEEAAPQQPQAPKGEQPDLPVPARIAAPLPPPSPLAVVSPPVLVAQAVSAPFEQPLARAAGGPELSSREVLPAPDGKWVGTHEGLASPLTVTTHPSLRPVAEAPPSPAPQSLPARFELVQQMGDRIRLLHHQGVQEVRVSLNPAHLGQVDIHLSRHEGQYSLHMIAETPLAKELLESQLGQLKQHLGQQGLLLDQASVDLGGQPEQGKQSAQEQTSASGPTAAFKLFPEADDTQEDGGSPAPLVPDSAVNYLA
jgi:hypothetical protein